MMACLCGGVLEAAVLWLLSITGVLAFGRRLLQRWRGQHTCSCPDNHEHRGH